jgi:S1-C subfamily serine protease
MMVNWTRWIAGIAAGAVLCPALALAQGGPGNRPEDAVSAATALVRPSVVAIETRFDEPRLDDAYVFWQYFRGPRPLYGLWGTGFVYKDPQYVVTAKFLMEHAEYVRVILDDGRSYAAEVVGDNDDFNVAVLKVDWGPDLEPISPSFGDSGKLKLGQPIAVVGKSLNSVDTFATAGIISALRKELPNNKERTDKYLQFDASYELSFIGAPIVDIAGKVVGMVRDTAGTNLNLGVPINEVVAAADKIISGDTTETWFGVETQFITKGIIDAGYAPREFDWDSNGKADEVDFGKWVSYVEPNSPADIAGLQTADLIYMLDDVFIKDEYAWYAYTRDFQVGQLINVKFIRKNAATGKWEALQTQVQILEAPSDDEEEDANAPAESALPPGHPSY